MGNGVCKGMIGCALGSLNESALPALVLWAQIDVCFLFLVVGFGFRVMPGYQTREEKGGLGRKGRGPQCLEIKKLNSVEPEHWRA